MEQPESTTFREGVVNAMHAEQGATTDDSPEADHPAYKYQVHGFVTQAHLEHLTAAGRQLG